MQKLKDETADFKELLETKGLKCTFERSCIYDEVHRIGAHFDADSLYERFKERGERISRATVYRTLPLLLEAGVIQKSAGDGKREFFEKTGKKGHHDHMVCLTCGKIIEFHNDTIEREQDTISRKHSFKIAYHDHRIYGYCTECH